MRVQQLCNSRVFSGCIVASIVWAAILAGWEVQEPGNSVTEIGEPLVLGVFTIEALLKVFAEGSRPWNYLRRKGNVPCACLLPPRRRLCTFGFHLTCDACGINRPFETMHD